MIKAAIAGPGRWGQLVTGVRTTSAKPGDFIGNLCLRAFVVKILLSQHRKCAVPENDDRRNPGTAGQALLTRFPRYNSGVASAVPTVLSPGQR